MPTWACSDTVKIADNKVLPLNIIFPHPRHVSVNALKMASLRKILCFLNLLV